MKKTPLPSRFSWKQSFLNKSAQGLFNRNNSKNGTPKINSKKYRLNIITVQKPQWLYNSTNNKPELATPSQLTSDYAFDNWRTTSA